MEYPATYSEAVRFGSPKYFTGKECRRGHIAVRSTGDKSCSKCSAIKVAEWRKKNPHKNRETLKKHRSSQVNLEKYRECNRLYAKRNPEKRRAWQNARRAIRLLAMPRWADKQKIMAFYEACPVGFAVDHVIPLQNKFVCGLHVVDNLQYLTTYENSKKHNRFEVI